MGNINRFNLNRIIKEYKTPLFFETGTFRGDGVAYALQSPFTQILSVEIIPEIADEAKKRFTGEPKIDIIESDSITAFSNRLSRLKGNCLFWLDAHFPGADAGMERYDKDHDETIRLPLAKETETISRQRAGFKDVLIIDDLRIYEDGPYQNGNVPPDALPQGIRNIHFIYDYFDATHVIMKSYLDEGYLLLFPKRTYKRKHFSFKSLFRKLPVVQDHYLNE